jgi:2,5-furandicarboxylate decarboxylase 1
MVTRASCSCSRPSGRLAALSRHSLALPVSFGIPAIRHQEYLLPSLSRRCSFQQATAVNSISTGAGGVALGLVRCETIDVEVPARAEREFELEVDMTKHVFEGPLGECTGYRTPGSSKPIARIKAITHCNNAYFQVLLTGVPPTENHS